ncbi:MAG: EF-Tu/IF-2/RF-3 family GTPase, partial [Actinomycetota bacterium]
SEEHLRILELLGLRHGLVVLTKIDQVDDDLYALAELDVEEHVEGTFLEGAPVVGVSATEGIGMDELRAQLDLLVDDLTPRDPAATPRLWVDRAFAPAGAGTVVTGTLVGGTLRVGDEMELAPGAQTARIRSLQSHHRQSEEIGPGNRAAVNLTGISHNDLGRGHVMIRGGDWHHTRIVDAELTVLSSLDHPISRRGAYVCYLGSAEFPPGCASSGRPRSPRGERAPSASTSTPRFPCCPATGSCSARAAETRPWAVVSCSTSTPSSRRPEPPPTARSSGSSPSAAGCGSIGSVC